MSAGNYTNLALAEELLRALDALSGLHPGFRPAHAKGLMCSGTFTPSPEAQQLTRAPHASRPSTPVTVRYSNSTGVPTIPDNDSQHSGPRGIGVRFHLADHVHTDIVAHSTNGFPVRTGEEFLEFLHAVAAVGAANLKHWEPSLSRTRTPRDSSRLQSRFRSASLGRHFSRSPPFGSPTPRA